MADDIFEHSSNVENLLSPFCYEQETPLPKTVPEVPGGIYLTGLISEDCTWGCSFNHSVIQCFPVDKYFDDSLTADGSQSSVAISACSYNFTKGRITCAAELAIHNQRTSSGARKLLLGLSYTSAGDSSNTEREFQGAVVIFDPIKCVPMKWIKIPEPVSSITVVSHFEEGGCNRPFFNETMMTMVGIAAVGLRGGSVVLVDLGLDDPNLVNVNMPDSKPFDLTYRLLFVSPHEYSIATKRHKAVSKRSVISLQIANEPDTEILSDEFHYCKPNGETMFTTHKNSVAVTSIEYVPAIGSLFVGYTCGTFQIWRVNNLELQYSSDPIDAETNFPVFGFCFQQPVDDPKYYCYVWVLYGNRSLECSNALLELHSLYFETKKYIDNFGFTYEGFKQCSKRLSLPLLDDFLPANNDGGMNSFRNSARPVRIWGHQDGQLMFCSWEVGRSGTFYIGTFDLNQWYSNHTRERIDYDVVNGLCPYWVALPVETADCSSLLMDLRIIPKSLMRWENPHSKLDVHLYPASISFRGVTLTNTGVSAFEHFGVQEKLIRIIIKDGPALMIHPSEVKKSFKNYGLEPVYHHVYGEYLTHKDQERFYIFSVLLENRRGATITRLASKWIDGSYANVGCTIDLIIEWISSYMIALRSVADEHWENLLYMSDDTLPPETIRFINFSNFAWTSLHRMLLTLMKPSEVYSTRGQQLEDIEFGLSKLVQYSAVLLMMYKAKLLPEKDKSFISRLNSYYLDRRAEARSALEKSPYVDKEYEKSHPLMIDHMMDSLQTEEEGIREEWNIKDDEELYPPQHVGYLANMFMWPDADPRVVSRVLMYFLMDLIYFRSNHNNTVTASETERIVRGDFKAVMDTAVEEYQAVWSLWCLDQTFHEEILVQVKERNRLFESDGLPWCAATVALTAAGYENDIADLLLKSCPTSLARLLFNLMTSSVSRYGVLAELMITTNLGSNNELLIQFFEISETRQRLGEFIMSKSNDLPDIVRDSLLIFLNNSNSFKRLSLLLMYHVHNEDFNKLEEEFNRIGQIIRQMNLSDSERRAWRLQKSYILHLLKSSKETTVQKFLRFQGPQTARQVHSTLSVNVMQAQEDRSPSGIGRLRFESRLPPQLRRLKLNETAVQDPLSPLRRYVGKMIADSATTITEATDDLKTRRRSRKSFARRISYPMARLSMSAMSETFSNNNEESFNVSKNVDLMSLLKTPALDHRVENRPSRASLLSKSINRVETEASMDETASQSGRRQSIMKEHDPSKPKVSKKVELRLENLSLHESDEEDEKDVTIYEDANYSLNENNPDVPTPCSPSIAIFEDSFSSVRSEDAGENLQLPAMPINRGRSKTPEPHTSYESKQQSPLASKTSTTESPFEESIIEECGVGHSTSSRRITRSRSKTPEPHTSYEEKQQSPLASKTLTTDVSEENKQKDLETSEGGIGESESDAKPKQLEQNLSKTEESGDGPSTAASMRITRSCSKTPEPHTSYEEKQQSPLASKTSTTEPLFEESKEKDLETSEEGIGGSESDGQSKRRGRNLRKTEESDDSHSTASMRITRTRSKTPERQTSYVEKQQSPIASKTSTTEPLFEESKEKDLETSEEAIGGSESSAKPKRRRRNLSKTEESGDSQSTASRRITRNRSKTPERQMSYQEKQQSPIASKTLTPEPLFDKSKEKDLETSEEGIGESESDTKPKQQRRRNPSKTEESDDGHSTASRRITRARSKTPNRELETVHEESQTKTATRSRKTPIRESESDGQPKKRRRNLSKTEESDDGHSTASMRITRARSKTPERHASYVEKQSPLASKTSTTEPLFEESREKDLETSEEGIGGSESDTKPKKRRRNLSKTEEGDDADSTASMRITRSCSKTPNRELETLYEERQTKTAKRSRKTPSRELSLENSEELGSETSELETASVKSSKRRNRSSRSKNLSQESTASSFSFEHTQELEDEVADEGDEDEVAEVKPSTSRSAKVGKPTKTKKRKLKYFEHHQELSTLLEDTLLNEDVSVYNATVLAPVPEAPKKTRKVKGIKPRPEQFDEDETESAKPTKRRKASNTLIMPDSDDDDQLELESQRSTRSNRSGSSRRSTGSTKGTTSRGRRGRAGKST